MYHPKNFKMNRTVEVPDGLLNGQSLGNLGPMRFGGTTVDDSGCGPLSVYNAMLYLGKPITLPEVLRELEIYAAPIGGRFGTSGILMIIFFLRHHIRFRLSRRIKKIDQNHAGVLLYWTKRPIFSGSHFVFYKKEEDGRIAVYNRFSNRDAVYYFNSIRELVPQKRMCMGYLLKDKPGKEKETE
ncbi:MAG: hypothetical protein J6S78_04915 [Lachnospiraceae bacterium]|nr:hypothetical protein [Lachnospiraceae bacterium]